MAIKVETQADAACRGLVSDQFDYVVAHGRAASRPFFGLLSRPGCLLHSSADALAVYAATQAARKIAVENGEPVMIESIAYRLGAHSTSDDPSGYRTKDEEAEFKNSCPAWCWIRQC